MTLTVEGEINRPPYPKDAGISALFEKAQAIYREIGKELLDVPLTGGGSDGNFTAALGIPTLDGLGADGKGAHAAYEQIYYSSLIPRTYLWRGSWRRWTDGHGVGLAIPIASSPSAASHSLQPA